MLTYPEIWVIIFAQSIETPETLCLSQTVSTNRGGRPQKWYRKSGKLQKVCSSEHIFSSLISIEIFPLLSSPNSSNMCHT